MDDVRLFQRCLFAGSLWTVVFIDNGNAHLVSIDGKQFKRNISRDALQMIDDALQMIDEFSDPYPEE